MNEIGKVNILEGGECFEIPGCGINTTYREVTREEYERITSIENWHGKLNAVCKSGLSDAVIMGYGFYGAGMVQMNGKYYYIVNIGNSCD